MGKSENPIIAWQNPDTMSDIKLAHIAKAAPKALTLEQYEALALQSLGKATPGQPRIILSLPMTEKWVEDEGDRLQADIREASRLRHFKEVRPGADPVETTQRLRLDKARAQLCLSLARQAIRKLTDGETIMSVKDLEARKSAAFRLFSRAADLPGVPTGNKLLDMVRAAGSCAAERSQRVIEGTYKDAVHASPCAKPPLFSANEPAGVRPAVAEAIKAARAIMPLPPVSPEALMAMTCSATLN